MKPLLLQYIFNLIVLVPIGQRHSLGISGRTNSRQGQFPRMCWFSHRLRLALDGHADRVGVDDVDLTVPHSSTKMVRLRTTAELGIARRKGFLHAEVLAICLGDVWLGIPGN